MSKKSTFTSRQIEVTPSVMFLLAAGLLQYSPSGENRGVGHDVTVSGIYSAGASWSVSRKEIDGELCLILTKTENPFRGRDEVVVKQYAFPINTGVDLGKMLLKIDCKEV